MTENLLFLPNNNFFGLDTFSYVLSDGIDTSIEYIGIFDVAGINDAPVMDEIEDQIIDEDTFLEYILNTQDVENDSIVYSATIANPDFLIEINIDTLTIYPPENWFGSINVDVFATEFNQDPLLDSASFNLIVNSVDDLPFVFESINEINLTEDFNYNWALDLDDYFIDIDGELAYNFSLSDTNIIDVEIINDTLTISLLPDSNGTLEMILTATNPTRAIMFTQLLSQ